MGVVAARFDVWLINLDPTVGSEMQKTRPCVVISPGESNQNIATVIIAPMTTRGKAYPTRVPCVFDDKAGQIVLDQIRTVDKTTLVRHLGRLAEPERQSVLAVLAEMYAE